jgi:hypothetical protein
MKWIPAAQLQAGMIMARDVVSSGGQIILARGSLLDEKVIETLARHHVLTIAVTGTGELPKRILEEDVARAEEECRETVRERFPEDLSGELMASLFRAVVRIEALERLSHESDDQ